MIISLSWKTTSPSGWRVEQCVAKKPSLWLMPLFKNGSWNMWPVDLYTVIRARRLPQYSSRESVIFSKSLRHTLQHTALSAMAWWNGATICSWRCYEQWCLGNRMTGMTRSQLCSALTTPHRIAVWGWALIMWSMGWKWLCLLTWSSVMSARMTKHILSHRICGMHRSIRNVHALAKTNL